MSPNRLLTILISLVVALASGAFVWVWNAHIELSLLRNEVTEMKADRHKDEEQDAQLRSLWRYGAFLHNQVDIIRFKEGLPPATKPRLDD